MLNYCKIRVIIVALDLIDSCTMQRNNTNTEKKSASDSMLQFVWNYMKNYARKCRTSYNQMLSL